MIVLVLVVAGAHSGCKRQNRSPIKKGSQQSAKLDASISSEDVSAVTAQDPNGDGVRGVGERSDISGSGVATATAITGLPTAIEKELDDEARRVDPRLDGWDTEAFHEAALTQLKRLGKWLEEPAASFPASILADDFKSSLLVPETTQEAMKDALFVVRRMSSEEEPLDATLPADGFEAALQRLLPAEKDRHAEFKIVRVIPSAMGTTTHVRTHISSADTESRMQINASWICRWETEGNAANEPLLNEVQLAGFEAVRSLEASPLLADRTVGVMGGDASFMQQIVPPLDYWRDRIDWRFGWEVVGAHGLAVGDLTGDGIDDVYYCETGGLPNRLLAQQADGTVRDVSHEYGLDIIEPTHGALIVDVDNDGDQDLIVAVSRFVLVYENLGEGGFATHPALESQSMIRSLAAVDYDHDRLLDIFVCGYSPRQSNSVGLGRPIPYHDANNGARNFLLRNLGAFRFSDVTSESGLDVNNRRFSYAAAWEDYDNDGDLDLYVANDFGRNNLYRNEGGRFRDVAAEAGVEDVAAGMSVTWGDFNRDGLPDIYVSNMFSSAGNRIAYQRQFREDLDTETRALYQRHARGNSLFQNRGDGTFQDVSVSAGVTEGRWAWGSNFADINNDGWQDLLVANGMVTGTNETGDL